MAQTWYQVVKIANIQLAGTMPLDESMKNLSLV
jgi:hypothetical protein